MCEAGQAKHYPKENDSRRTASSDVSDSRLVSFVDSDETLTLDDLIFRNLNKTLYHNSKSFLFSIHVLGFPSDRTVLP